MKKYPYNEAKALVCSICKAAEDGAYGSRAEFLDMLKANPDIAAQGYNAFGKIFFWNGASEQLYGYSEAESVNRDLFETILPPEIRPFARSLVEAAARTGKTPEAAACDLLHRNGEYVTVFSGHLVFHWDGPATPEFYCVDISIDPQPV